MTQLAGHPHIKRRNESGCSVESCWWDVVQCGAYAVWEDLFLCLCALLPVRGTAATIEYLPLVASNGMVNAALFTRP